MTFTTILLMCALCTSDPDSTPAVVLLERDARVIINAGDKPIPLRTYACECSQGRSDDEDDAKEDAQPTTSISNEPNPTSE